MWQSGASGVAHARETQYVVVYPRYVSWVISAACAFAQARRAHCAAPGLSIWLEGGMVQLPLELPGDIVVFNTFVALQSDFSTLAAPRAQSCPPELGRRTPGQAKDCKAPSEAGHATETPHTTIVVNNLPLRASTSRLFAHLDDLGLKGRYDYASAEAES